MDWLSRSVPESFDKHYRRPRFEYYRKREVRTLLYNTTLPMLCQGLPDPAGLQRALGPGPRSAIAGRGPVATTIRFCSNGCKDIFDNQAKYISTSCQLHRISRTFHFVGRRSDQGRATLSRKFLKWYHFQSGPRQRSAGTNWEAG